MKSVLLFAFTVAAASSAFADCDKINGNYVVQGQYNCGGAEGPISNPWGQTHVSFKSEDPNNCYYALTSQVKSYAEPLKTGVQLLAVSKSRNELGFNFSLSGAKGTYTLGDYLRLVVPIACGGSEGAQGSDGDMTLFLSKSK